MSHRRGLPRLLFALAAGVLFATGSAHAAAGTVVLLRSRPTLAYEQAARGLRAGFGGTLAELTLESENAGSIERRIAALRPVAVVALGARAARFARERFPRVPLIFAFVPDPERLALTGDWVTGVSTEVPVSAEFLGLRAVAPAVRRIGVVYGTASPPHFLRDARAVAAREGCSLLEIPIGAPGELTRRVREAIDRVDGLWLPADGSVATPEAFRFLLELSLEHRKPLLVFAEPLVRSGALVAVCPDFVRTGSRAAESLRRIVAGERPGDIPIQSVDRTRLVVNRGTARALGLELSPEAARRAEVLP